MAPAAPPAPPADARPPPSAAAAAAPAAAAQPAAARRRQRTASYSRLRYASTIPPSHLANTPASRFADCDFARSQWSKASTGTSQFVDAAFERCDLSGASLAGLIVDNAAWTDCRMQGVVMRGTCFLRAARFVRCDLRGAVFERAVFFRLELLDCRLDGASFVDAYADTALVRGSSRLRAALVAGLIVAHLRPARAARALSVSLLDLLHLCWRGAYFGRGAKALHNARKMAGRAAPSSATARRSSLGGHGSGRDNGSAPSAVAPAPTPPLALRPAIVALPPSSGIPSPPSSAQAAPLALPPPPPLPKLAIPAASLPRLPWSLPQAAAAALPDHAASAAGPAGPVPSRRNSATPRSLWSSDAAASADASSAAAAAASSASASTATTAVPAARSTASASASPRLVAPPLPPLPPQPPQPLLPAPRSPTSPTNLAAPALLLSQSADEATRSAAVLGSPWALTLRCFTKLLLRDFDDDEDEDGDDGGDWDRDREVHTVGGMDELASIAAASPSAVKSRGA
ncbi:hypothetical protein HK105_203624 [Polyrhizophydium stewartii]|uniref:Pentapeptide repeat-containing protein n=1 Tax=Polyrhizophydium stewartii TaxID=2732419 RepID=A0ABR4NBF0_9FUNG